MDKKTFLLNLQHALSVLEEKELEDIISEYEQHIDLKVENGLTEEEAIADFGAISELTAEILEAYHVRADYGTHAFGRRGKRNGGYGKASPGISGGLKKEKLFSEIWRNMKDWAIRVGKAAGRCVTVVWTEAKQAVAWGKKQISRPFRWLWEVWNKSRRQKTGERLIATAEAVQGSEVEHKTSGYYPKRKGIRRKVFMEKRGYNTNLQDGELCGSGSGEGILHMAGRGISRLFHGCIRVAIWCIRLGWNVCCVGISLIISFFGLFCLYGLGILIVLLVQNYPFLGITVGCLGLVLCTFSLAAFMFNLRWVPDRRKGSKREEENWKSHREEWIRRDAIREGVSERKAEKENAEGTKKLLIELIQEGAYEIEQNVDMEVEQHV